LHVVDCHEQRPERRQPIEHRQQTGCHGARVGRRIALGAAQQRRIESTSLQAGQIVEHYLIDMHQQIGQSGIGQSDLGDRRPALKHGMATQIRSSYTCRPYRRLTEAGLAPQRQRRRAISDVVEQDLNCSLLSSPSDNGARHGRMLTTHPHRPCLKVAPCLNRPPIQVTRRPDHGDQTTNHPARVMNLSAVAGRLSGTGRTRRQYRPCVCGTWPRRRPRRRGQGAVRLHRPGQEGCVELKPAHHDAELTLDEFAVQAVGQGMTATSPINP